MQALVNAPVTALVALAYVTLAFATNPFEPTMGQLFHYGALVPHAVAAGQPWRLITYAFLHGGILHLMLNMLGLMSLGPALELSLGSVRFAVLYLVSSLAGGILICLLYEPISGFVIGGSGALFGMMGAIVALGMRAGRHAMQFFEEEHGKRALGFIAVNTFAGFAFPGISNTCHFGGLLSGFAVTFWFLTPLRVRADRTLIVLRAGLVALLLAWLCYVTFPVARWDFLVMAWDHSPPQQRAGLHAAAERALDKGPLDEADLAQLAKMLRPQ